MANTQETKLSVQGMTCGNCVKHVTQALQGVPGVEHVEVQRETNSARVQHAGASVDAMIEAIREEGYEAQVASS